LFGLISSSGLACFDRKFLINRENFEMFKFSQATYK